MVKSASVAFIVKVLAAFFSFALSVLLARYLGAKGSGEYYLVYSFVLILVSLSCLGFENSLVKYISIYFSKHQFFAIFDLYRKAMILTLVFSSVVSLLFYYSSDWISLVLYEKPEIKEIVEIMSMLIVPVSLYTLHAYCFQGLNKIALFISILSLSFPLIIVVFLVSINLNYNVSAIAWVSVFSAFISLVLAFGFWVKVTKNFKGKRKKKISLQELFSSSFPLLGVNMMNLLIMWYPVLLLGVFFSAKDVGVYNAVYKTAMLISFVLVAINSIAAPKFAQLYEKKDYLNLRKTIFHSSRIMVLFSFPILLIFVLFPEIVLSLFGKDFVSGANILIIIALGQFVNVSTGSVGYLLVMTGHEKEMRNIMMIVTIMLILLGYYLINKYGLLGAGITSAIILSIQNLIAAFVAWRKMKLNVFSWMLNKY